jgi:hypothetical protein
MVDELDGPVVFSDDLPPKFADELDEGTETQEHDGDGDPDEEPLPFSWRDWKGDE